MGWRGTLRSIEAAQRRSQREALRRQRQLERQRKELAKMEELERAAYEVQVHENYIDTLLSVHKECGSKLDWAMLQSSDPPIRPENTRSREKTAQAALDEYEPTFIDKLLRRTAIKRVGLKEAIGLHRQDDEKEYQEALAAYEREYEEWSAVRELARRIQGNDVAAYMDAIRQLDPLSEINALGSSVECEAIDESLMVATIHVHGEEIIPREIKTLLKSGKLSVKKTPITKYYELYQDYVCACSLRVAQELFALLPVEMVIITAVADLLNTQSGHMEEQPILSVAISGATVDRLNMEMLDPSDAMGNFVHNIRFRKTKGFAAVVKLEPSAIQVNTRRT
jgi:hypothetical protein